MITLLGEFILEGMEPVKWELLANTLNQGCRLGCTVCKGMVDVLFPLLFVDIDILLHYYPGGNEEVKKAVDDPSVAMYDAPASLAIRLVGPAPCPVVTAVVVVTS